MAKSKKPGTQADADDQQTESLKSEAIDVEVEAADQSDPALKTDKDTSSESVNTEVPDSGETSQPEPADTETDDGSQGDVAVGEEHTHKKDADVVDTTDDALSSDDPVDEHSEKADSEETSLEDGNSGRDADDIFEEATDQVLDADEIAAPDDLASDDKSEKGGIDTKPVTEPAAAAAVPAEPQKSGFMPLFFGGIVAAVLGFLAGQGGMLENVLPERFKAETVDLGPLQAQLDAQTEVNATLEGQIAELSAIVAEAANAESDVPDEVGELLAALETLSDRIDAIETQPAAPVLSDDLATSGDVAELQSALETQRAELEALSQRARLAEENATLEAQKVLARAALTQVSASVETGGAYSTAIVALEDVAPVEVPQALRDAAETGVITLAELQNSFPDAARSALAAARSEIPEAEVEGVGGFLRRQLSVRSVVPREGDDPDAILSRAEAAVRSGALSEAITELGALPDAARAAMQDWLEQAQTRDAVQKAAAELANSLTSN